jgi:3-oxo-5-alpha-steroid 4-dehydrogenase 3
MGLAFYTTISLNCFLSLLPYHLNTAIIPVNDAFDLTDKILITLFIWLSIDQFQNHYHLSTLPKYSVPKFGMFQLVGSAHYLDEIILYLIVAMIGNLHEKLSIIDINYILGWAFVAVNLSISSLESYSYYKAKFPEFTVKYSIIPGIL